MLDINIKRSNLYLFTLYGTIKLYYKNYYFFHVSDLVVATV